MTNRFARRLAADARYPEWIAQSRRFRQTYTVLFLIVFVVVLFLMLWSASFFHAYTLFIGMGGMLSFLVLMRAFVLWGERQLDPQEINMLFYARDAHD